MEPEGPIGSQNMRATIGRRVAVLEIASEATGVAGRLLADAGCEVLKLESPTATPPASEEDQARRLFRDTDKRSISLAIDTPQGRDLLGQLLPHFDIVVESGSPGQLTSAGFGYDVLSATYPSLTLVSITPFGQTGPYAHFQADSLVAFAMGGLMFISGTPDLPPVVAPYEQVFMVAGVHAAMGALASCWAARRTGQGHWIDVSMMECLAAQECTITNFRGADRFTRRTGSQHLMALPGRIFACKDGFIHIFINLEQAMWERFLQWIGSPAQLASPELADIKHRWKHADLVNAATEHFVSARTRDELVTTGQELHLPVTPVYSIAEALNDPQVRFLDLLERVEAGPHPYVTLKSPIQPAQTSGRSPAPAIGQHTDAVLGGLLGLTAADCTALRRSRIV